MTALAVVTRPRISRDAIAELAELNRRAAHFRAEMRRRGLYAARDVWVAEMDAGIRTRATLDLLYFAAVNEERAERAEAASRERWDAEAYERFRELVRVHLLVRDCLLELLGEEDLA